MNKEFVKKMIKAELLRYEAIKEILPEDIRKRVDNFEKDAAVFIRDIAVELFQEKAGEQTEKDKKETKKVEVDFS